MDRDMTQDDEEGSLREVIGLDLDEKIRSAAAYGKRYTPSRQEWDRAFRSQRRDMTWPADVLAWIRRGS